MLCKKLWGTNRWLKKDSKYIKNKPNNPIKDKFSTPIFLKNKHLNIIPYPNTLNKRMRG